MTYPKKELNVACSYLLRLIKTRVELSPEQINVFKRTFHEIVSRRFIGHWFPATPHRGSAYRCLQTKHWKDPVLRSIAEHSCIPLHRYLPAMFTMWIDPGEVAVCFGDEGTWCPLYKQDINGVIQQTYSDGEESGASLISDDDLSNLTENVKTLNIENKDDSSNISTTQTIDSRSSSSLASSSRTSSPFLNTITKKQTMNDCNVQKNNYWFQQQISMSDGLFQGENF